MSAAPVVSSLVCRRAARADLPRLLELLADDDLGRLREASATAEPAYTRAFEAIDTDPNQLLLVGVDSRDGARIVAMLQLTFIPGLSRRGAWRANIESVRVASARRGRGIGAWIIREALLRARERGCAIAQLTSDKRRTEAHRFYGQLGFSASHEGFKLTLEEQA
jgi:GNAT superfamily N-acetyltransferase